MTDRQDDNARYEASWKFSVHEGFGYASYTGYGYGWGDGRSDVLGEAGWGDGFADGRGKGFGKGGGRGRGPV